MRLDIGSAWSPDPHADVRVDIEGDSEEWNTSQWDEGIKAYVKVPGNPVDVIADAHALPFRDGVFDSARAGLIFFWWTGTDAIDEAFRVLKIGCVIDAVVREGDFQKLQEYIAPIAIIVDSKPEWDGVCHQVKKIRAFEGQLTADFPRRQIFISDDEDGEMVVLESV